MFKHISHSRLCLIGMLCLLSGILLLEACQRDDSPQSLVIPDGVQVRRVIVNIHKNPDPRAKAAGIRIEAYGIDEGGGATGTAIEPILIPNPAFPLSISMTLYMPPCVYRIVITTLLTRDPERTQSLLIDLCRESSAESLSINIFEEALIGNMVIQAPVSANAGEIIPVSCSAAQISAPDSDTFPLSASLSEQSGQTIEGPIGTNMPVSGSFPDPFPLASPEGARVFRCTITDGRSTPQSVNQTITRILPVSSPVETPEPAITPTLTPIPSPEPNITVTPPAPAPTSAPTSTPTPTPTPTPDPCLVLNEDDSGSGSLRQTLNDAVANGCATITFDSGVSTIGLSGQLLISSGTLTIDGSASGVTVSGNTVTRVFYVNGATVTFQNLTISDGDAFNGGGIYNSSGTVILGSGGMVSNSTSGGGIYNDGGTVTVDGAISGNISGSSGIGIDNDNGTIIVGSGGTVSGNSSNGINNSNGGIVTVNGTVSNNGIGWPGSGIYSTGGTVTVNGTISGNSSNGINNDGGTVILNGTVSGHSFVGITNSTGGGIVTVNGTVSGNSRGGIDNYGGIVTINGTVSGNMALGGGGGIYNASGTVNIGSGGRVINNQAPSGAGGGIYHLSGTVTGATAATVNSNTASSCNNYYNDLTTTCILP